MPPTYFQAADLPTAVEPPCLSLYQPTHRWIPERQQDVIRFRNLVRQLEATLARGHDPAAVDRLVAPFRDLAADDIFWRHTFDGLVVFGAPGLFRVLRLQRPVAERAVVADSFHLKPLLRQMQSADRYQILALTLNDVRLYEGNRDVVDEIPTAPDVPRTLTEALGDQLTESHLSVSVFRRGGSGPATYHSQGSRKDESETDADRFFTIVDRAIFEHHSKRSKLPLVLAALPEHQGRFRLLSRNVHLVAAGINSNPDALTPGALREQAWEVMRPRYTKRLADLTDTFRHAAARGLAAIDPGQVAEAAIAGRVGALLLDAGREQPGHIDTTSGTVGGSSTDVGGDDVLDDLGELVLQRGGDVVVVPSDQMPVSTGCAAILRF